jgi:hypothetical protein
VIGAKDDAVSLTQFNANVSLIRSIQFVWPTCDEVLDRFGSAQVCQTPPEFVSHFYSQVVLRLLVVLTDLTK